MGGIGDLYSELVAVEIAVVIAQHEVLDHGGLLWSWLTAHQVILLHRMMRENEASPV
jgi:N6-adenosine-specific RNA methylase IME4